jgi:hypothetical protein
MITQLIQSILPAFTRFADTCASSTAGQAEIPAGGGTCDNFTTNLPTVAATNQSLVLVIQIIFGIIGAMAVIYIMFAAFHFMRSQGDPQTVAKARNGIIYALIGLAIVVLAELIVTFVLGRL